MMDRVVWESRHKFVYFDEESQSDILDMVSRYPAKLNSDEPIVVYISDSGLPKMSNKLGLDDYRIQSFHSSYYSFLISLGIIETLIHYIDNDILNERLNDIFELYSKVNKIEIKDVIAFRNLLLDSKETYKMAYINYMETGILDFYDKLDIPFVIVDNLVARIKKDISLKKYFALFLDLDEGLSICNKKSVNSYIASRCNGYLSMNVLLDDYDWKYYYSSNGQLIEYIHDYTEVDLRKHKTRSKSIQK